MAKAIKGHISDPTANIALARCYRQKRPKPLIPIDLILREVKDVDGTTWRVWVVHTHTHKSTGEFWSEWRQQYKEISTFIQFLETLHIIYRRIQIVRK